MGMQRAVRVVVLTLLVSSVIGGLLTSHALGQRKTKPLVEPERG